MRNKYEVVVKMLFRQDNINSNEPDKFGKISICYIGRNEHKGVGKILLVLRHSNFDYNNLGKYGQIPVCWAAENVHKGVVEILPEQDDIGSNNVNKFAQT